ncbi:MAG TPA: insulinase family protein [bacterium (Candidatus Stahlbacteria)]|nr:insulinase family protein [Candidatus Stahlbacteria bacterium]
MIAILLISVIHGELENGLDYYLWPEHKIPMVEIRFIIESGSIYDPDSLWGLAYLTHRMLERGVEGYSYLELRNEVERLGARLSFRTGREYLLIQSRCLSRNLDKMLKLIALLILKPTFPESELEKLKTEVYGQIKSQDDDPFMLGFNQFYRTLYQSHPLGHRVQGEEETIQPIQRQDLLSHYNENYLPDRSALVMVGDFDTTAVKSAIDILFGNWLSKERKNIEKTKTFDSLRLAVVYRDLSQVYIFYGNQGISRLDSRFFPTRIGNFILGGSGLTSRIATRIREEAGLAYIASSWVRSGIYDHPFIAMVQTKVDSGVAAFRRLKEEIECAMAGISTEEIERARSYYLGHLPLTYDTYRERADILVAIHRFDLGLDYLDRVPDMVRSVGKKEVESALRDVLAQGFVLVVVGPVTEEEVRYWISQRR